MNHISKLFNKKNFKNLPWLIIGKDTSFDNIKKVNLKNYNSFALNSSIMSLDKVDICHFIDFNVFESFGDKIYKDARFIIMPINPHFNNKPSKDTIYDLVKKNKLLKKFQNEGRLFWYNHLKGDRLLNFKNFKRKFYKNIKVEFFSAEAPFQILGNYGFKNIKSIGVDGGSNYSTLALENSKLKNGKSSLLLNGRNSFNDQFSNIIDTIFDNDIIYEPINSESPIKIYVGSQEEQMLSVKILEYSIKKRTNAKIKLLPLHKSQIKYPVPKDPRNRQRTPFSFQRFTIPQLNNFEGKAIYFDSDMQVLNDIKQLWNLPMGDHDVFATKAKDPKDRNPQFSVMLLNCNLLKWSVADIVDMLDKGELNYISLMKEMKVANNIGVKITENWNSLEYYNKSQTSLIHYTDMPTQPWVSIKNPLCKIWMKDLIDALKDGFISMNLIDKHIKKSWIRPSLKYQIENNILDSTKLPKKAIEMDIDFIAPYKRMT